jgi:uncharacterized cupredoxin-like copper-binding protein
MTVVARVARLVGMVGLLLTPLAMAQAQPASTVDWSTAQSLNILLVDNRFVPDRLTFRHGVPYQLHLENDGRNLHEFTAPAFLADAIVRNPGQLANGGQDIVVQPGEAVDVELVPLKPGSYQLTCADHDWEGMTGEIIVE